MYQLFLMVVILFLNNLKLFWLGSTKRVVRMIIAIIKLGVGILILNHRILLLIIQRHVAFGVDCSLVKRFGSAD